MGSGPQEPVVESPRRSAWTASEPQGVTFVELFYDLVFVFAVTQITGLLRDDLTLGGVGRSLLVLWLVWWAWTQFTWTLNPADTSHSMVRLLTLAATGAAFFMAVAIPDAFSGAGLWFAIAYSLVRLVGLGMQVEASWGTEYMAGTWTFVGPSLVGLAAVISGGLLDGRGRLALWALAILIDIISAARAGRRTWDLHAEHFAERHGLIIIIALGESLIAAGIAAAEAPRGLLFAMAALVAVTLVSAAWWIYFASTMAIFQTALEEVSDEGRAALARDVYSFGHLPIVAGIIAIAIPVEEVLAHPDHHLETGGLVALFAGVCLYVGGLVFGRHRSGAASAALPGIGLVLATGAVVLFVQASGLWTLAGVALVLVSYAIASRVRHPAD